jgi:hypothetical protein
LFVSRSRLLAVLLSVLSVLAIAGPSVADPGCRASWTSGCYSGIKVIVEGYEVDLSDATARVANVDGTAMIPARGLAKALGLDVAWNQSTKTATFTTSMTRPAVYSVEFKVTADSRTISARWGRGSVKLIGFDDEFTLPDSPVYVATPYLNAYGQLMIPLRYVSEQILGYTVNWKAENGTNTIELVDTLARTGKYPAPPEKQFEEKLPYIWSEIRLWEGNVGVIVPRVDTRAFYIPGQNWTSLPSMLTVVQADLDSVNDSLNRIDEWAPAGGQIIRGKDAIIVNIANGRVQMWKYPNGDTDVYIQNVDDLERLRKHVESSAKENATAVAGALGVAAFTAGVATAAETASATLVGEKVSAAKQLLDLLNKAWKPLKVIVGGFGGAAATWVAIAEEPFGGATKVVENCKEKIRNQLFDSMSMAARTGDVYIPPPYLARVRIKGMRLVSCHSMLG